MKLERSNVNFPLWRKKVDSSLFQHKGTTIPGWACGIWGIDSDFSNCILKRDKHSMIEILFENNKYGGWVTCAKQGRKTPAYRLWFAEDLQYRIKQVFLMSFMRDIEYRLRKEKSSKIEDEIPFWEFLDIEYDRQDRKFYFTAYYKQKPAFPELFNRLIGSPIIRKIDDELREKKPLRIYKQDWKPREALELELEVENVLYTLIDTKDHLVYIGEAGKLVKRLLQDHPSIPKWDYYRYNVLPNNYSSVERLMLERMLISNFASMLNNNSAINCISISDYKLVNDRIDLY